MAVKEKLKEFCKEYKSVILLSAAVYITVIGIDALGEITKRQKLMDIINSRCNLINSELVNLDKEKADGRKAELACLLESLEMRKEELTLLAVDGSAAGGVIARNISNSLICKSELCKINRHCLSAHCADKFKQEYTCFDKLILKHIIDRTNSDLLLLYLILCASVLGSTVDSVRTDDSTMILTFADGIGAGIVCFLAIKSGSISSFVTGEDALQNPYFNSFIGFLGGVFSTYVFDALRRIAKTFFEKINPGGPGGSSDSPAAPPAVGEELD